MNPITNRTSYLRGLADGMEFDKEKAENKLLLAMLSVMEEIAAKLQELDQDVDELDEYVASMDDDLSEVEDLLFDDEGDDEDLEELDEDEEVQINCPYCGEEFIIKAGDISLDGEVCCPACGKNVLDADEELN
ncbi:MAG TPA: hypothetical protein PKU80_00805 [Candidatus Limiplasma sp.]|nr:hypothetical protein [Candidatus Limiplasma sp.]HRX08321.1 hypothetical protein [Candidatus Limiplasma sp.]